MAAPANIDNILRYLNLFVALLLIAAGVLEIVNMKLTEMVVGAFVAFFGAAFFILEFSTPDFIKSNCPFLFKNRGRGLILIFLGALVLDDSGIQLYFAIFVMVVGVIYVILSFTGHAAPKPR
jgi:hypothetical protein